MDTNIPPQDNRPSREERVHKWFSDKRILFFVLIICVGAGNFYFFAQKYSSAPDDFTAYTYVEIPNGYTLEKIAALLYEKNIIRSPLLFMMIMDNIGDEKNIDSGLYLFKDPINLYSVARRFAERDHGIERIKVTFPEGMTAKEMSVKLKSVLSQFDENEFLRLSSVYEGYLFPDTYFFFATATSGPIIESMRNNFDKKTADLRSEAQTLGKNWRETVITAALIEKEVTEPHDRRIVSGIIWNRLRKNMPLQIDATLGYITGKASRELTQKDLRLDSPYNTYKYRGLPPTAIGNPGIDSIDAALHPEETDYLYYLSSKSKTIYYAKTFDEHKLNRAQYLK